MYNLMKKENLINQYPIINANEVAIINFVSCEGVMGTPLGNRLKALYEDMFNSYKNACFSKDNPLTKGKILLWRKTNPWIINIPIKKSWKEEYNYQYLEEGFEKLSQIFEQYKIESIAIQEGTIPKNIIEEIANNKRLPTIKFYKEGNSI